MRTQLLRAQALAVIAAALLTPTAHTQTVAFPDSPLQTSSNISVKPNLLFVLDDSGSMAWSYTPDQISSDSGWTGGSVYERMCYDSGDNSSSGDGTGSILGFNRICQPGDVPYMAPFFNTQYYNPAIRYRPGVNADGTSMQSQTSAATGGWTSVTTDAYGVSKQRLEGGNANTVNLTQFPERVWCNDPWADTASNSNCKLNTTTYQYPDDTFSYGRDGWGNVKYRYGQPYYWNIAAFEHCTSSDMKDCVVSSSPTTQAGKSYSVPSRLRYCKYTGGGTTLELNKLFLDDCQAKFDIDADYTYPRFLGKVMPSSALQGAYARIRFATSPTVSQDILTITVDGVNIIDQTFTGYTSRQALATAVANSINSKTGAPEFRACAGGTACNTLLGITGTSDDSVYIYPTVAAGSSTRMTGAASNNFGAPVVNGSPAGAGSRSRTVINITALGSPGDPPAGGLAQITVGGTNLLSGSYDNGDMTFTNANNPNSVALTIANAINNSSQSGNFEAIASGSTVILERKAAGSFFDGTAVSFSYTNVARRAAISGFNVSSTGSGTKNVTVRLGSNSNCSADTINVVSFSTTVSNNNNMASAIRSQVNGKQGLVTSGSNATVNVSSGLNSNLNGWYICFSNTGDTTLPSSREFNSNGRSEMSGNISAPPFSGGAASGTIPSAVTGFQGGADFAATAFRTDQATWTKTVIASGNTYPKSASRSDCAGATCTYAEEMTNFANWYTYYRTRMQSMKSAGGQAFSSLSDNFRVGFTTINDTSGSRFIKIRDFTSSQKTTWYDKFYETGFNGATPLRQALSRSSRIFSGIAPFNSNYEDPIQYSCQQNFVLLTTDGYWNETGEGNIVKEDGTRVNDVDGANGVATPFFDGGPGSCPAGGNCLGATCHGWSTDTGKFSSCNTLADVAYHFATTDLRRDSLNNCSNQTDAGNTNNLCTNDVKTSAKDAIKTQHVTMFSLGLGVDGTLAFQDDYETAGTGDYAQIRSGALKWPQVKNLHPTAVDDLWHAAVNGKGKYFSAKDPESLAKGLQGALAEVNAQGGAGAAAATSNLEPITGDNFAYVASYTTVKWTGNLEARQINLSTGEVSIAAEWCAENVLDPVTNNISCTGTMSSLVQSGTDTRSIFTFDSGAANKLKPFLFSSLTTAQKAFFAPTGLSQYAGLDAASQAIATAENLVNYLRGHYQYDTRSSNTLKAFRQRETILADVIGSQPIYVKKPAFTYNDAGYSAFVSSNASRSGTVYIGANDGMLHAFDAVSGVERWAYVPTPMLPKMRQLADYSYPTNHRFFVDGSPKVGDVYHGGSWKTILVGGYSSGGTGYFALDITDPHAPKALWEFPPAAETDAGASYSAPIISKLSDGTWAVIVSSGYNNSGQGYVYVLNAVTGAQIRKISTGVGTLASPSGLGRLSGYAPLMPYDNTTTQVYGGDLKGNLWRFNPSTGATAKIAELKDGSSTPQPITTKVELVNVDGQVLLYVGTGKYLETGDLSSSQVQSFYGIRDRYDSDGTITDPRTTLNQVTLVDTARSGGGADRTSTGSTGNILSGRGWYADFPISGERINIDPQFVNGTVVVLSNIPSNTACTAGGNSYINFFNYSDGNVLEGSGDFAPAIVVGFVTVKVGNSFIPLVTRSDSPNPQAGAPVPTSSGDTRYRGKRVSWKELNTE